jgi:hypothetical protein
MLTRDRPVRQGTPPITPNTPNCPRKIVVSPGYSMIVGCGDPEYIAAIHRNLPADSFDYNGHAGILIVYGDGPMETADYLTSVIYPGVEWETVIVDDRTARWTEQGRAALLDRAARQVRNKPAGTPPPPRLPH